MSPCVSAAKRPVAAVLLAAGFVLAGGARAGADAPTPNPVSMNFAAGGAIHMNFKTGTAEVIGAPDEKISVSWRSSKYPEDEREVSVQLRRTGPADATLDVKGPGEHMKYRVEVPRQSSVNIEMQAGELVVRGIQGNLDAELLAGEMDLRLPAAARYRKVSAAVTVGEISARPWDKDVSGLFRSLSVTNEGDYELSARLLAGELRIRSE